MPANAQRVRRTGALPAAVRDTEALAAAITHSGMSLRRVAVSTNALNAYKPDRYDSVSYQTIANLLSGRQTATSIARAQAIEEALRVIPGALFTTELVNEQTVNA